MRSRIVNTLVYAVTITVCLTTVTDRCLSYTLSSAHAVERVISVSSIDSSRYPNIYHSNAFSIGCGIIQGDVTYGYYALFGTVTYARKIFGKDNTNNAAIECAVQYTSRTLSGQESGGGTISTGGVTSELARGISKAWIFDASYTNTLLSDRFSLIVGPSIRWHSNLRTSFVILSPFEREIATFEEDLRIGAHTKLQYTIPLSATSELGIRGQIHLYLGDFTMGVPSGATTSFGRYGTLSVGVFIRGMW
jgi:hypothetical protein